MKTKLTILIFLISLSAIGQDRIKLGGTIGFGYNDMQTIIFSPQNILDQGYLPTYQLQAMYGELKGRVSYKGFSIYVSNLTHFNKDHERTGFNPYFNPIQTKFLWGSRFVLNKNITFVAEYYCIHNIEIKLWNVADGKIGVEFNIGE